MPKRDRLLLAGVLVSPGGLEIAEPDTSSRHPRAALAIAVVGAAVLALALGFVGGPPSPQLVRAETTTSTSTSTMTSTSAVGH